RQPGFGLLPRQDGAAVFSISTISFLLPCPLDRDLAFLDFCLPGIPTGLVLARSVPLAFQDRARNQRGPDQVWRGSAQQRA
ncbi:hypothetical protein, partial [Achromobacter denitrificans]|uniref:hypothetical protein n=1 Tax=Achromobacter denitrificans TaxID=32002 RepID=UPI003B9D4E0F